MGKQKSLFDYIDNTSNPAPKKDLLDYTMTNTRAKEKPLDASGYETFQGDSDYDQSLGHGMSQSYNRAVNQPWQDELGNALGRTALNIVPSIVGNLASALDLEDYFNQDNEVGNIVTKAMEDVKNNTNENILPIYRKNPGQALNVNDSAWWFENGGNLLESAGSFVATGGIISKAVQMLPRLAQIGALAKNISPEKLELLTKAGQTLTTAIALNQSEAIPSAMQVYDKVYQEALGNGIDDEEAKQKAADAASYTININRANIPLNLTSSLAFLRNPKISRGLIDHINSLKNVNHEGLQEAGEEAINLIAEKEGVRSGTDNNYEYDVNKTISDLFSKEGLESTLLGYVGGAVQTGGQAYLNRSQNAEQNQRANAQQIYHAELDNALKSTNTPTMFSFLQSAKDQGILQRQLEDAIKREDYQKAEELRSRIPETQAFYAFENSSADKLEDSYKQLAQLTPEEAAKKGLDINPHSKDYYKLKAHEGVTRIKELEETYNKLALRVPKEVLRPAYFNTLETDRIRKEIRSVDTEVLKEQQKSLEEVTAGLDLTETSNYDYLGELTSKKEDLANKLKQNVLEFKDIISGKSKIQQNDNTNNNSGNTNTNVQNENEPENLKNQEAKQLIKDFQDTKFETTEDIQKAVYNLPEELRSDKTVKEAIRNKEQRVAYKQLYDEGEKVEVIKNGKKLQAVAIPEMYRTMNNVIPSHISVNENGVISTFTPDNNKQVQENEDKSEISNSVPEEIPMEDISSDFENIVEPDEFISDVDIPEPDAINSINFEPTISSTQDIPKERKTKASERAKLEREAVKEIKNTETQYQLTIDKENEELISGIGQKIGYHYDILNNPNNLNGEVKLTIDFVEGINAPFIFVEEDGKRVTKLIRTLSGVSEDIKKQFQDQFDSIVEYIKKNGSVTTKVASKKLDNYLNINEGVQSGLELLTTNDRAKSNLPDGEIYIGTVQGGVEKVRTIENDGQGGTVSIGKYPQEGRHFVVIKASNGVLVPAYLQDSQLKDIKLGETTAQQEVVNRIESIKNEFLQSELPKDQKSLNSFWNSKKKQLINPIVNVNREGFNIGLTLNSDGTITTYQSEQKGKLSEEEVYQLIGTKFFNIEVKKLVSDPAYTKFIVNNRILTTDLNTEKPVINTQLKIDVSFLSKPERLRATEEPLVVEPTKTVEEQEKSIKEEQLRKLRETFNPKIDPSKVNDIKTKLIDKQDYKKLNVEEELDWIKTNIPQVPVNVVNSTLDIAKKFGVEAHGIFTNAMIYIAENGATGTGYHEAFHAVFNLYLTENQRANLLKDNTEEGLANQFEEYVLTEGNIKPNSNIISDFFRDLYYWIKDIIGLTSTKDIFDRINTGKFANSPIKQSQFKPENKYKVVEGFNPIEQKQRVESLLYQVFNGLVFKQNKGSIISLDADNITAQDYNSVWSDIEEMWKLEQDINPHPNREKVLNNWNEFKELTTKELKRFGIKAVEKDIDLLVSEDTKERIYDVAYFKNNIKDTLSTEMKLFVATIPVVKVLEDGKFENDTDELGNPKFVDRHQVYSDLSKELSNILTIEGMINKIDFLANSNPQWYYISDFLKRTTSIVEAEGITSNNFRNKFYSTFRNNYNKFLTIKKTARDEDSDIPGEQTKVNKYTLFETNKRSLDKQIIGKWRDSNLEAVKKDVYTPYSEEVRKNAIALNKRDNKESLKVVEKYLNQIGINITLPALENHKEEYFRKNYIGDKLKLGKQPYTNYLLEKNKATIGQILNSFSQGKDIFGGGDNIGELSAIKELARYQVQVTTDSTGGAFLNGEDEMVYPINSPSFASNRVMELRENLDGILQKLSAVPFLKNSKLINDLLNPDSNLVNEFEIRTFDTINDSTKKKQSAIPYSESQEFEYVVSKINGFFNNNGKFGWFFPPTPSDRGNITPVKLSKLDLTNTPLFIEGKLNTQSEFYTWLMGAIEDEFSRIKQTWDTIDSIPENERINNYHYKGNKKGNAFYFNQFYTLNELIYDDVNNPELRITSFSEIDQNALYDKLSKEFRVLFENERIKLSEKGVLDLNGNTYSAVKGVLDNRIKNLKQFIDEYIANQFYANLELSKLFSGDIAFYKGSPLSESDRKSQYADYDKRFGQSFVPGRELGYSKELSDVVKSTFRVEVANDIEIANETLKKQSKKYLKNNQTDAQGFITLERLREVMIGQGTYTDKYRKAWDRVKSGSTDIKDISIVFQPIKGFYYSQDINEFGVLVPTQVKYSTVPLIPAFYQDGENIIYPELKALAERMEEESIDEYVFESGIKVGRTKNSVLELQNKNWRIPQVVPYKDTTEERFGSQKRKLITENINESDTFEGKNLKDYYQELISKSIEEDFKAVAPELANIEKVAKTLLEQLVENNSKGLPDKFEKAMEVIDTKYGKDTRMSLDHPLIKKRVESVFNSFIDSRVVDQKLPGFSAVQVSTFGQVKVASDLKFIREEDGNVLPAQVRVTPKYFIKMLKKKGVDINQFVKDGNIDLNSIPKNLLRGTIHRIPTQGKNSMLPFEILEFTPNEMGSIIFLPVEVTTQMGSDFDIDKVFVEMYNFEVINDRLQKMNRNPNEVQEEIDNLEIKIQEEVELLKELKEFRDVSRQTKNSLKYKLKQLNNKANYYINNKVFQEFDSNEIERESVKKDLEEVSSALEDLRYFIQRHYANSTFPKLFQEQFKLKTTIKKYRQNKIVDIHYNILTNPKYFDEVVTPNNSDTLIEIKNEVIQFEKERDKGRTFDQYWFSPWLQEEFKSRNQAGKQLVGFYSIASVSHSVAQDIKLRLVGSKNTNNENIIRGKKVWTDYRENNFKGTIVDYEKGINNFGYPDLTLTIETSEGKRYKMSYLNIKYERSTEEDIQQILSEISISGDYTVNFEGKELWDLSKIKDIKGTRISDNIAEVQTAAVDNAKDPILGYLNDNLFTAPVKSLLLRAGVPLRHTNYFATQPIIVDLTKAFFKNSPSMSDAKALQVAINEVVKKYSITQGIVQNTKPTNFTLKSLEDGLRGKGDVKAILEAFLVYKTIGDNLYTVSLGLSPDRKGTASTMSENLYNQKQIENAKTNSYITFDEKLYNKHSLAAFEKYGIDNAVKLSEKYFSDSTNTFQTAFKRLSDIKGESLSVKELQDITYQFYTFLHTGSEAFKMSSEEKLKLFTGPTSVVNRLRRYIVAQKEGRENNLFLNELSILKDEDTGFELLDFNATANPSLSSEEKQVFEDSILELYRAGGAKKTFAIDLLKYCFATNGFNRGVNTFIDYFPIEMFEESGLNEYYRTIKQNFNEEENSFSIDRFVDQYIQNNFDSLYWIPQYNNKTEDKNIALYTPAYYYNRTVKRLYKYAGPSDTKDYIVTKPDYIEINKLGRKNLIKEYDIDSDIASIISTNNKSGKNQIDSQEREITEKQLTDTLEKLSAKFGIKYNIDKFLPVLGRYKNGQVYINPTLAKSDTPFHEFAHPFVETIKKQNPVLYLNLQKQITTSSDGIQILNKVKRLYPIGKDYKFEDQIEEAIVTAIGQYATNQLQDRSLIGAVKVLLKRIATYIRDIIEGNKDLITDELNPNMTLQDLGSIMVGEQKIVVTTDIKSKKDQRDINKAEEIVKTAIETLRKKIKIYEKKGSQGFLERERTIKATLEKQLEQKQFDQGVISFVANVRKELDLVKKKLDTITNETSNRDKAETLKSAHTYAKSYQDILKQISYNVKNIDEIKDVVRGINADIIEIDTKYYEEIVPLFAKFIRPFVSNTKVNIEEQLTVPQKDISFTERWLDAISESSDNTIKWIDKAVKTYKEKARLKALNNQKTLLEAKKELETSGVKDTKFIYEVYEGKLTGNLVTEFNQAAFNKAKNEMYEASKEIAEDNRQEFISKWWRQNSQRTQDGYTPANKYKNKQFETIQASPAMKKFYNTIWEMKKHTDALLPIDMQKRMEFLAPQIRKDIIERIKDTETSKVNEVLTSIKEGFIRNESDIQFGITDEAGRPINFLPTYFTNKLEDMNNLSTDIVSTLSSYNYMSEDFNEMNKIVHQLEIGRDIIKEREVDTGKIERIDTGEVDENGKKKFVDKVITKSGNESNTYQRLEDYYNMVIYGQVKLDEGTFGGSKIDKAKTLDSFGRYIAINSLAFNVFSGISNITYGTTMGRIEGFAKEYFDHGDLLFADKTYTKELPKLLSNIGQRLNNSKIELWSELFNTAQDFDEKTRDIESNRTTVFSRLFKTSSLFFISKAGEHYMQMRTSLALANRTMVKHKDGTETNLWDAMEVKNNRLVPKEGYNISQEELTRFILKQNGINKRLHGVYNNIDKSAIQKYALGRMAIMFRKWIKPGLNKRFEKLKYNEELEMDTEGYYYTLWRFMGQVKKDLSAGQFSLQKNWNNLSETEKRNMFRVFSEVAYLIAASILAGILTELADDDEENWMLAMSAYQANRLYTELRFYSSAKEAFTILKSPAAGINAAQSLVDFIWVPQWFDEIERGKYKGMTKFERNAIKVIPLYSTIRKLGDPEEQLIYYKK